MFKHGEKVKVSDVTVTSAKVGLIGGSLLGLSDDEKATIVRLMARIQEKAYRRGLQQGVHFCERFNDDKDALKADILKARFSIALDSAPMFHVAGCPSMRSWYDGMTDSEYRLSIEHGDDLSFIGIVL